MTAYPATPDFVTGDTTGIAIPAHPDALVGNAAEILTSAFRAYGSISPDNAVAKLTRHEVFPGGNSGKKLKLSVEYARAEPGLHGDLFVKFSRHLEDAFRDRRRYELKPEINLASLSRLPDFPVSVAKPYFADFNDETGTGLLISEQIAYGEGAIEPLHPKCKDYLLDDPVEHYRAMVASLARLAAVHKSGRLSPRLEQLFPYDAETAASEMPIPQDEGELRGKVARWAEFAARCSQLMPASLTDPAFFARWEQDIVDFHRNEAAARRFLQSDPEFIALCHWNSHIDNAWFWRDQAGVLHCGLLDWGMVRQMNVGYSLWGGLSGCEPDFLKRELDGLLGLFANEMAAHGGPAVDPAMLALHFDLSLAILGMSLMMDTPALVAARLPEATEASGPHDPVLERDQVVHGFLHVTINFLNLWERRDFGASLRRVLELD